MQNSIDDFHSILQFKPFLVPSTKSFHQNQFSQKKNDFHENLFPPKIGEFADKNATLKKIEKNGKIDTFPNTESSLKKIVENPSQIINFNKLTTNSDEKNENSDIKVEIKVDEKGKEEVEKEMKKPPLFW